MRKHAKTSPTSAPDNESEVIVNTNSLPALSRRFPIVSLVLFLVIFAGLGTYFVIAGHADAPPANCFASPGSCGYPDPAYGNVGAPAGTAFTQSGSIVVNSSYIAAHTGDTDSNGRFIVNGLDVTGTIEVAANNVTIENTKVAANGGGCGFLAGCGNSDIKIDAGITGTTLQNDSLTNAPDGTTVQHAVYNYGDPMTTTADGLYVYTTKSPGVTTATTCNVPGDTSQNTPGGGVDSMWFGPGIIKNSYEVAGLFIACDHIENVYEFAGQYLEADHNTFFNPTSQTATIFVDGKGGVSDVHYDNNFLTGGGYTLYPAANGGSGTAVITNNRFARCLGLPIVPGDGGTHLCTGGSDSHGYYPKDGSYGLQTSAATNETWTGNYWDDAPTVTIDQSGDPISGTTPVTNPTPPPAPTTTPPPTPPAPTPPSSTAPTVSLNAPLKGASVTGLVTVSATATASSGNTIRSLQFKADGNNIGSAVTSSGSTYSIAWDSSSVSNGSHVLSVVATDSAGNSTTSSTLNVGVVNGSGIGNNFTNGILGSDATFFPLTVWDQTPETNGAKYKAIGINTFSNLYNGATASALSALQAANLGVLLDDQANALSSQYAAYSGIIKGWGQQDEPDNAQPNSSGGYGACISANTIIQQYQAFKAADPTRPVVLNFGQAVAQTTAPDRGNTCTGHNQNPTPPAAADQYSYSQYAEGADVVSFDVYPINDGYPITDVATGVDNLKQWVGTSKPIWAFIETTQQNTGNGNPTPAQVKAEVWLALTHGASGIQYFAHILTPTFTEAGLLASSTMSSAVQAINSQVTGLATVLNSPTIANGVTVSSSSRIDSMVKQYNGNTYVFAVSPNSGTANATFTVPGMTTGTVTAIGESRALALSGGSFSDSFAGYGVHLYEISPVASPPAPDKTPPTVSLGNPSSTSGLITATATAADNVGVSKVEFYLNGSLKSTVTTTPYDYIFDSTTLPNGTYTLQAKAYDAAGNSASSGTVTVTVNNPDTTPPTAPTNLTGAAASSTQVNLSWTGSTDNVGVAKYNVLRNGAVIGTTTSTTYNDTASTANAVTADTTYSYAVEAVDAAGNTSLGSNMISVTTPKTLDTTPPTAPTNLTGAAASSTQVNLSWTGSTDSGGSGLAGYEVFRNGIEIAPLVTVTSFGDATAQASTTYSYTVKAIDGAGNVSLLASNTVSVTTPSPVTVPTSPNALLGTTQIQGSVDGNSSGQAEAYKTKAGSNGSVGHISLYLDSTSTATKLTLGLYGGGSKPTKLLAQASLSNPVKGAWNTVSIPTVSLTSGTTYWITLLGTGGTVHYHDTMHTGAGSATSAQTGLTSLPDSWKTAHTYKDGPLSAYLY